MIVGKALKNKNKHVWFDAGQELKKSTPTNIKGMHEDVFSTLKLGYDYLESEEAKSIFLLCCLFPANVEFSVERLVRYGIGLRLFKDIDTVEEARRRAHVIVSTLTSSFLLIVGKEVGFVKMHDVVCDFAQIIASKDKHIFLAKAGIGLKEWPNSDTLEEFTGISLMSNDIHELPDGLDCPKLQALLLMNNSPLFIRESFCLGMKALNILDSSRTQLESLPQSLSFLLNLRTLCFDYCKLPSDLDVIGKLSNLEILSFFRSDIKEIPRSFSHLDNLRLFDLTCCGKLMSMPKCVIENLHKLEELYMSGISVSGWGAIEITGLHILSRLTGLGLNITSESPDDLIFFPESTSINLTRFFITVADEWITIPDYYYHASFRKFSRVMCLAVIWYSFFPGDRGNLIKRTECLFLFQIVDYEVRSILSGELNQLKYLSIQHCSSMRFLMNAMEWVHKSLHNLEELWIVDMACLVEIWLVGNDKQETETDQLSIAQNLKSMTVKDCPELIKVFPSGVRQITCNVTYLSIGRCDKLKNLFTPSIVKHLVQLRSLIVSSCKAIRELVTTDQMEKEEVEAGERIVFPSLYFMQLTSLESLTSFCPWYVVEFPSLEKLTIKDCPKLGHL